MNRFYVIFCISQLSFVVQCAQTSVISDWKVDFNPKKFETVLNKPIYVFTPHFQGTTSEQSVGERKLIPPFDITMEKYITPSPDTDKNKNYLREKLKDTSDCYTLRTTIFGKTDPWPVIVHVAGAGDDLHSQKSRVLIEAVLKRGDHMLLFMDCGFPPWHYPPTKDYTGAEFLKCAQSLAVCLNQLTVKDSQGQKPFVHVIVHDLAAPLAATAVNHMATFNGVKLRPNVITGLDPTGHPSTKLLGEGGFLSSTINELAEGDADKLIIYHSNMTRYGLPKLVTGATNVIINDGKVQEGCNGTTKFNWMYELLLGFFDRRFRWEYKDADQCNHDSAFYLFAVTLTRSKPLPACKCDDSSFKNCDCNFQNFNMGHIKESEIHFIEIALYKVTTTQIKASFPENSYLLTK